MENALWAERAYRRDAAAAGSGIHPKTLDVLIHRMRDADVLFSERQGGARVFAPRDICVLRVGYEIERAGRSWLDALAIAFEHLETPPAADAVLVMTPAPVRASGGPKVMARDAVPPADRDSLLIVPIGAIVADIMLRIGGLH